jgi:hypothetical protein
VAVIGQIYISIKQNNCPTKDEKAEVPLNFFNYLAAISVDHLVFPISG